MRRKTLRWATLALALAGLTCRDDHPIGPGAAGRAVFDVRAFALFAPGDPPVPVESLEVVFRRSDESIASADTVDLAAAAQGDSFVVSLDVPLDETPQNFMLTLRAFGGGIDWYAAGGPVTLVQGANDPVAPIVTYVGPGANADSVRIAVPTVRLVGGVAAPVTATVYGPGGTPLSGVPVGFRVGNAAVASVSGALLNSATVTGAQPVRDSTWVYAETPTHLRDSVRVGVVPPPAQLVTVSGGGQSGPPGLALAVPFTVRVLDALGDPFPGDTVNWSVSAGAGTLSATSTVTDSAGFAATTLTPTSLGIVAVQASAPGLAGSPQTFSATAAGGNAITVVSGNAQSDTVGAALLPLVVRVADGQNNPVAGAQVAWTRVVGTGSLSADTTTTAGTGQTQVIYTLGAVPGVDSVRAQLVGSPANVLFAASTLPGALGSVTLDRTRDTIARAGTLQYTATLRDAQGNVVSGTVTWSSTAPAVATVSPTGLATALAGGTTRIVAAAGGRADTADLYVRALATIAARPADTVVTAIGDSLQLGATALSNFGDTVTTGLVIRYASATPTVATVNAITGRVHLVGAGNAVVLVRDSVSGIQGAATLRVNQVAASLANTPADSILVGVSGRGQIVARAFDRNGYPIPGRSLGWATRAPAIATVDQTGMVTGVALGLTWVVDSLVEPGAGVFKDSTLVAVVALPPAVVQWAYDSTAVGNGSSLAVALSLTRTSPTPVVVRMTSSDSFIAKPTVRFVTIPANSPGTTATINGLAAGRVDLVAADTAGVYLPDTMTVTVVSTIEFREIGSFSRQPNFYVNNNQTYRGQVFLSDPAPPGGLGVTFVYGVPGKSVINPSPAIIPAGQLSADVLIQGIGAGRDSVVPTSGGFVGRFSYVYVAPESLRLQLPYPYTGVLGAGQTFDPYVHYTYAMDHPQVVSLTLTPGGIGAVPDTVTVPTNTTYRYFTVRGTTRGQATLTASAPGWISDTATVTVSTPRLYAYGTGSIVAGDPTRGYWGVYSGDSLDYQHNVIAPVAVTAVSRNPAAVVVELPTDTIPAGTYVATANNALRAEPTAGGDSAWIVLTAPGYLPDSFLVRVTAPTLTFQIGYPYNGRVPLGTRYQNAGYVSIPYARPDTFWVVLGHTRRGVLGGPDSVAVLPGQTYRYFDVQGDSLGSDTVGVARATGYVVSGGPFVYGVGPLRVRPYSYPTTLYTISAPQLVSALAEDSATGFAGYYALLAPLTVTLVPRNPGAIALDSGRVVIPAGTWVSGYDTLRVTGVDTLGSRIVASAPGAATDSSGLIRVYPTPLSVQIAYPYTVSRGLRLAGNRVYVTGGNVPDTVRVALSHTNPGAFALSRDMVVIPRGQAYSDYFEIRALDSAGTDTIVAAAVGYVTAAGTIATQPSRLDVIDPGANHLTTEAPYRMTTYVETRSGWGLNPISPVTFTIVSSDPGVILIDSAATVNPTGDTATAVVDTNRTYGYFKVRFVGTGTARLRVSAPGFDADSTYVVTVTGPSLNVSYTSLTVGRGQIFTSQRVYVDNPVASPLVVRLLRSDSLLPPASQAFALAADSVVIPTGQTYSPFFDITGNTLGSANLVARATGYSQATAVVSVGQPRLQTSTPTITLYVGERPPTVTVSTLDQSGQTRIVATPLVIAGSASDTAVARPDSATRTVAARQATTSFALRPRRKGSVDVVYTAAGYTPDTTVVTVDTAKLDLQNPPHGLGPGQVATTTMYVQLPNTTDSALVVSLSSTNPGVLTVPAQATIPAGSYYAYFNVTGTGVGVAAVIVTAPRSYPDTLAVRISRPRLAVTLTTAANAGQRYAFTIAARDSLNIQRVLAAPLTVTLASSTPGRTQFDSLTTTIAAGQSSVTMGVSFDTAGTYVVTASAAGYDPGADTTAVTGALVRMVSGNLFAPPTVTIPTGRTVTWRNDDAVTHTTTADGASPLWNSGNRTPGQTYQRTFSTAGTFTYHCTIHAGMTGTIVVQ